MYAVFAAQIRMFPKFGHSSSAAGLRPHRLRCLLAGHFSQPEQIQRSDDTLTCRIGTFHSTEAQSSRCDVLETYEDGYYLSCLFSHPELRRRGKAGQEVRVIDYQLKPQAAEPFYRLVTSILDSRQAPADQLAPLYGQRWELENALDELKTHLRGPQVVLRRKTPRSRASRILRSVAIPFLRAQSHARSCPQCPR
jgi:hypothetical protein